MQNKCKDINPDSLSAYYGIGSLLSALMNTHDPLDSNPIAIG